jgi:hypothetical protein
MVQRLMTRFLGFLCFLGSVYSQNALDPAK